MTTGLILLMGHLLWWVILWGVVSAGALEAPEPALALVLFIPFFGTVALLAVHYANTREGARDAAIDDLRRENTPERDLLQAAPEEQVVPLTDALTIGDSGQRREAMLDMLMQEAPGSLPDLTEAQENADPEVVHYATTAMTELAANFEARLSQAKKACDMAPNDSAARDHYIAVIEQYLSGPVATGTMRRIHEQEYESLLSARYEKTHDVSDGAKVADLMMNAGDFDGAAQMLTDLDAESPYAPAVVYEKLRYDFETGRGEKMQALIADARAGGRFIPEDLNRVLAFWEKRR